MNTTIETPLNDYRIPAGWRAVVWYQEGTPGKFCVRVYRGSRGYGPYAEMADPYSTERALLKCLDELSKKGTV